MNRIYIPSANIINNTALLTEQEQLHHLKNVLRVEPGDKYAVFDDSRSQYTAEVTEVKTNAIKFRLSNKFKLSQTTEINLTVVCAIPKKSKMEDIIDRLTQLGVARIIPLESERVIVKLDSDKKNTRLQKWQKVALNASQQSQRDVLPIIDPIMKFKEVLGIAGSFDLKLIPTLPGKRQTIKDVLAKCQSKPKTIIVLIGPEGDFTPNEIESAIKAGFVPLSLGKTVLRVETAAIAVASFIKLYAED